MKLVAVIKLLSLLLYTLTTYGIYFIGLLPVKIFSIRYEPWRNLFMLSWAKGVAFIFNMTIEKEGEPPKAPFFLVSNHLSYLDIIPLYHFLNCTFVAKKAVRSWPLLGFMINTVGVIFVDRTKRTDVHRVNEKLSTVLNEQQGLILFPEGTSSGGDDVLPFHSSLLQIPALNKLPVHVASIRYETRPNDLHARDSVCFFGARDGFLEHLFKLAQTRGVYCKVSFGTSPSYLNDRKELTAELHQKVKEIFEPTS